MKTASTQHIYPPHIKPPLPVEFAGDGAVALHLNGRDSAAAAAARAGRQGGQFKLPQEEHEHKRAQKQGRRCDTW